MSSSEKVRLQIPVDADLAEWIDEYAKSVRRSQSFLIGEVLVIAVDQRERFFDWLGWRAAALLGGSDLKRLVKMFGRQRPREPGKATVYLQVNVSPELAEKIERLGVANQRTRPEMAACLLNWLIEDEKWVMEMARSRWFQEVDRRLGGKRGDRGEGNREENEERR